MAHEYTSDATERCERALGTLMRGIGQPWRDKICLVGGLVPLYLVPGNDHAQPEHIGSTDVDLALRLVVGAVDYAALAAAGRTEAEAARARNEAALVVRQFSDALALPTEGGVMTDPRSDVRYDPIVVSAESTVVAEYVSETAEEAAYQSEAALEREFISVLQSQAYEYLPLTSEAELIANLRAQLEALNGITFSDAEWERFFRRRSPAPTRAPSRRRCASSRTTSRS